MQKKQTLHTQNETGLPRNPPHQLGQNLDPNNTNQPKAKRHIKNVVLQTQTEPRLPKSPLLFPWKKRGSKEATTPTIGFGWSRW